MPTRPYQLDVGFDQAPVFAAEDIPQPEQRGGGLFQFGENWKAMAKDVDQAANVWASAFATENDVVNTVQLLSQPIFQYDPNFNVEAYLKETDLWDEHRWDFLGVGSAGEFLYKARKLRAEEKARETLRGAGPQGVVASIVAGAASPTILLPFVGPGVKGAKAVAAGLAWGAVGGTLQEIPLQLNQDLRTLQDSFESIASSTVLGGVFGGALGHLHARVERLSEDMVPTPGSRTISPSEERVLTERALGDLDKAQAKLPVDHPDHEVINAERTRLQSRLVEVDDNIRIDNEAKAVDDAISDSALGGKATAAGADILDTDAGGLANMLGIGERLTRIAGPVTSVLGQKVSAQGRRMMAQLSTAGLRLEGNLVLDRNGEVIGSVPSNDGGTVEGLINSRRGDTLAVIDDAYKNYSDYWYGSGKSPGAFRNTRASTAAFFNRGKAGKLNRRQFFDEVGKAMVNGDTHEIPEVAKTAQNFRQYYDRLLKEAQDLGMIPEEIKAVTPDLSFLNRVYDVEAINRAPTRFLKLLEDHFTQALNGDLKDMHTSYQTATAHDTQRLADMEVPLDQAVQMKKDFKKELDALDAAEDDQVGPLEDMVSYLRSQMAEDTRARKKLETQLAEGPQDAATRKPLEAQIEQLRNARQVYQDEISRLQALGGPAMEARKLRRAELKRRIRNLNRSRYMVEEKARAKYDKIDALEEQNIDALRRVVTIGNRAMKAAEAGDAAFDKELTNLRTAVNQSASTIRKFEGQIDALHEKAAAAEGVSEGEVDPIDDILGKLWQKNSKYEEELVRFDELNQDLEAFQNVNWAERGRDEAHAAINDSVNEALERINRYNQRRDKRIAKLESDAKKLDIKAWEAKKAEIIERQRTRKERLREKVNELGGDNFDIVKGTADFSERAKEIAQIAKDRITGVNIRLPGFDAMADKRGTELARTLSIDSNTLMREGYLVNDAEHLLHVYANTLIPDIELTRRLGAFAPDGERNLQFKMLNEEANLVAQRERSFMEAEAARKGKPLDEGKVQQRMSDIAAEYRGIRRNLQAVIDRLRGTYGMPSNPDSLATRAVQVILASQALRFLGTAGLSQLPDIAKPIARYGLSRTMRSAWIPMLTNFKAVKLSMADARRAFVAVESATAQRAFQLSELLEYSNRQSKFERGLKWATSKSGILFGFAPITDLTKTLSSMAFNSKLMDSIDLALNSSKTSKDRLEAIDFLNSLGLNENLQRKIWDQMTDGGAEKMGGTWVPQTDKWTDPDAVRAYRAALYSEGASSVITPGVEVPKVVNSSLAGRLFWNLKSFLLASTSKTLMAGLQQRDAAVLNGIWVSLALGALSYYLKSVVTGGAAYERMQNATWEQWVDEAVDASGLLGALSYGQQLSTNVPYLRNLTSLSGGQTARATDAGMVQDAFGPTADLAFTMAQIVTGLDKPSRSQVHKVRTLLPLQNWFLTRRLFDSFENNVGDKLNLEGQPR